MQTVAAISAILALVILFLIGYFIGFAVGRHKGRTDSNNGPMPTLNNGTTAGSTGWD